MMQIRIHGNEEEIRAFLRDCLRLESYKLEMGPAFSDLQGKDQSYMYGKLIGKAKGDELKAPEA